jgi:hypothetical protein
MNTSVYRKMTLSGRTATNNQGRHCCEPVRGLTSLCENGTGEAMRRLVIIMLTAATTLGWSRAGAADVPANWIEVAAGAMFTVKAPPGTTFERTRTGDAFSGTFHGAGFDLAVEFGYHRDELKTPAEAEHASVQKVVIDDKPGSIATASMPDPAHPYYVGLHVPAVENDIIGPLSLVVDGKAARAEDQATVERIYQTVKFGFKN